jgi:hypothetical protein
VDGIDLSGLQRAFRINILFFNAPEKSKNCAKSCWSAPLRDAVLLRCPVHQGQRQSAMDNGIADLLKSDLPGFSGVVTNRSFSSSSTHE